jgi:6-phosphogluconolactonase/glucosamine-6-phosphate isomerase/deaminase
MNASSGGEPEIVVLDDVDAVADEGARRIARSLAGSVGRRGRADWATTGGSAPSGIYRLLAVSPLREEVPWEGVHLWWGDDRYVPADHPLSNVLPAEQILLNATALAGVSGTGGQSLDVRTGQAAGALIPTRQVHPFHMADAIAESRGPAWAAARYDAELRESGIEIEGDWPVFDLVLLGVGPDGHIMSVFPESAAFDSRDWVLPIPAPSHVEPHVSRATLNPAVLDVALEILVVVTGGSKAAILGTVFGENREPRRWPAQLVRRAGVTWLLDQAAAASLPKRD